MSWRYDAMTMGKPQHSAFCLGTFKVNNLLKQRDIELSKCSLSRLLGPLGRLPRPIVKAAAQDLETVEKSLKPRDAKTRAQARAIGAAISFVYKTRPFATGTPKRDARIEETSAAFRLYRYIRCVGA